MNHPIMPVTAKGEPIPLVKLGQGREPDHGNAEASGFMGLLVSHNESLAKERFPGDYHQGSEHESGPLETPQTFAEKLRAVGCQEPVVHITDPQNLTIMAGTPLHPLGTPVDIPLVSQRGFKAGVFATCLGGAFLAALYLGAGALICGCVASGCVGFVAGMLITEDWK